MPATVWLAFILFFLVNISSAYGFHFCFIFLLQSCTKVPADGSEIKKQGIYEAGATSQNVDIFLEIKM